jgi:hypothetical protein
MLECNIDARGKAARFLGGLAGVVFGLVAAILLVTGVVTIPMGWYMVGASVFGGAFAIFEARAGWCVVRALGIKTPL